MGTKKSKSKSKPKSKQGAQQNAPNPKDLIRRSKSRGLKKLKWYCQMCNKKCGDKNGFKLHCDSESHQRQLLLFAENQDAYLREFSNAFENDFLKVFKELFDGKRTRANDVYQEYIRHNNHIHMNATVWHTLGEFVEYLGQTKKCQIDQDETFGWHIQLIDKERELRIQKMAERLQNEKTDEEREILILQQRIESNLQKAEEMPRREEPSKPKEFVRKNENEKIKFGFAPAKFNVMNLYN